MPSWLDNLLLDAVDAAFALRRYPLPSRPQLESARIVSHRGERDDLRVFENTFAAFDPLRGSGVFGLELDVRWTRDRVPVVFHDADLLRLFGDRRRIADLSRAELARVRPEIPDLPEFVHRYAGEFHLMVEVKDEPYPDPALQSQRLAEALAPALAERRCHVLSLEPALFAQLPHIPAAATLGVARMNPQSIGDEAARAGRAGFASHYLMLGDAQIAAHHAAGRKVGCGFPASRPVLYREIARGVDWIFTNLAQAAERWRQAALAPARATVSGNPARRG